MTEAGEVPLAYRRKILAGRMLIKAYCDLDNPFVAARDNLIDQIANLSYWQKKKKPLITSEVTGLNQMQRFGGLPIYQIQCPMEQLETRIDNRHRDLLGAKIHRSSRYGSRALHGKKRFGSNN